MRPSLAHGGGDLTRVVPMTSSPSSFRGKGECSPRGALTPPSGSGTCRRCTKRANKLRPAGASTQSRTIDYEPNEASANSARGRAFLLHPSLPLRSLERCRTGRHSCAGNSFCHSIVSVVPEAVRFVSQAISPAARTNAQDERMPIPQDCGDRCPMEYERARPRQSALRPPVRPSRER